MMYESCSPIKFIVNDYYSGLMSARFQLQVASVTRVISDTECGAEIQHASVLSRTYGTGAGVGLAWARGVCRNFAPGHRLYWHLKLRVRGGNLNLKRPRLS